MEELGGPGVVVDVVRDGEWGSRREVLSRSDVAVLCGTTREAAGGGRGRKLDGRGGRGSTDWWFEEEGISTDDLVGRRAWIGA